MQSSSWAKIKDNWDNERLGFYQNGQLVAVASVLIKNLPLGLTMLYIPRGPIMDYLDRPLLTYVLAVLREFGRKKRAVSIKFDPLILLKATPLGQTASPSPESLEVIANLQEQGAIWTGLTTEGSENIQPRFQANLYRPYFENLSKSTRQSLRTAQNKGVTVTFGGLEFVDLFSDLMKKTEFRKNLQLRDRTYYKKLLETYPDSSYITLATLSVADRLTQLSQQIEKVSAQLAGYTDKTKPTKLEASRKELERLETELALLADKQQQGLDVIPLAGTLSVDFGATSEIIYAGMDDTYRSYQAAIVAWHQTALHGFERDLSWQNMGGVENSLDGGLYHFKSKFNPVIEELIGEFNLPVSRLYHLSDKIYRLRKKLRRKS